MESAASLAEIEPGQYAIIKALPDGCECRSLLIGMGLYVGQKVRVISRADGSGPLLLAVGEGRLALGRGMAWKIAALRVSADMDCGQSDQHDIDTPAQLGMRISIANYLKRRGGNPCRTKSCGVPWATPR